MRLLSHYTMTWFFSFFLVTSLTLLTAGQKVSQPEQQTATTNNDNNSQVAPSAARVNPENDANGAKKMQQMPQQGGSSCPTTCPQIPDEVDQTDALAIPLDNSEEEENVDNRNLQQLQQELAEQRKAIRGDKN